MSKIQSLDRYGCTVGGRRLTWTKLTRDYLCNDCGGGIVHSFTFDHDTGETTDDARCGQCGARDFVHQNTFVQQIAEALEVERGLPEPLRNLLKGESEPCLSVTEATADLFD